MTKKVETHRDRVAANRRHAIEEQRKTHASILAQAADADARGDVVAREQLKREAAEYADTRMIVKPSGD